MSYPQVQRREAAEATIRIVDKIDPIPENTEILSQLYSIYTELYKKLKDTFVKSSAIVRGLD